ncbi:hypothetical protein C0J52_20614 [Blattella germanica]|nr:hypothetical protein C0J52_20614 [Blattella germanica]
MSDNNSIFKLYDSKSSFINNKPTIFMRLLVCNNRQTDEPNMCPESILRYGSYFGVTFITPILVLSCLAAVVLSAPQAPKDIVPIIKQNSAVNADGSYTYRQQHLFFETGDGTKAEQAGQLKNLGPNDDGEVVTGSFSFVAPDGQTYTVTYVADENGFQPQGAHLLPIPEAIARSLEYNKAHPEEDNL